jgi:copper chaperone CopZ
MKFRNIFTLLILLSVYAEVRAQVTKAEIMATGLTCSMCSNAINKQLKALAAVDSVVTDLNTNTFTVHIKKDAMITPGSLKDRVEKAGFFVGSMVVSMSFDNFNVPENKTIEKGGASMVIVENNPHVLNGEVRLKIVDKGYVTQKEFKKFSRLFSKIPSFNNAGDNEYHVIIN